MITPQPLARIAGGVYLLMAILGVAAHLGIRTRVHVPGDAIATAENIAADVTLFRFAMVADMAMATTFVALGVLLYLLFRQVDRRAAFLIVLFVTVGAGMILLNLVFHHAALLVATDATYSPLRSDELVLFLMDLHATGYTLAGIFFGLWLLPVAFLAYRSGWFPRTLSVLLAVAGVSWIIDTVATLLCPDLSEVVHTILRAPTFAEFWLIVYLLVKGVRTPAVQPERH